MEQNSKTFTALSVLVFLIGLHVGLIGTLIYGNYSTFPLFIKRVSEANLLADHNNNATVSEVKVLQGKTQDGISTAYNNIIASQQGWNDYSSLISSTNESEKLLHGLLASGFDESSCISRVQSHLFRKASPHKPSPYLISKLRNYEEIHRRCGPYSGAYNTSMKNIESSNKNNNAATMCKYVLWIPYNGLENQILNLASTFLYALLTDRVLLVKFGKDIENLFCEPFLNSTWILPNNSPFWDQSHIETYKNLPEKEKAQNSVQYLDLTHIYKFNEKFFHSDHNQDLLNKVPLLIFFSNKYFVPALMNSLFNEELNKMFPDKETVFHHLARYLFHPSNDTWELLEF